MVTERLPSFGAFQLDLETTYSFEIPKEVRFPGVLMDIGYSKLQVAGEDNDNQKFIAFNRAAGARGSANEHAVPEQLFSTADNPVEGVSAVRAIAVAAAQGQRIYTISQNNLAAALDALTLDQSTESDIRNAVNAGLHVAAHQHPISHAGFDGAGYIILDAETGSGAYKISGGADGAQVLLDKLGTILLWLGGVLTLAAETLESVLLGVLSELASIFGIVIDWARLISMCDLFTSLAGLISSIFVGGGILLLFTSVFLLALPALFIVGVMVVGSIISGIIAGQVVDGFVERCE